MHLEGENPVENQCLQLQPQCCALAPSATRPAASSLLFPAPRFVKSTSRVNWEHKRIQAA